VIPSVTSVGTLALTQGLPLVEDGFELDGLEMGGLLDMTMEVDGLLEVGIDIGSLMAGAVKVNTGEDQ